MLGIAVLVGGPADVSVQALTASILFGAPVRPGQGAKPAGPDRIKPSAQR